MSNQPDWVTQSEALEREDKLKEAEAVVFAGNARETIMAVAELYRKRWLRLLAIGETEKALEAREKSSNWAYYYASTAGSGGEGTARAHERDDFLRTL